MVTARAWDEGAEGGHKWLASEDDIAAGLWFVAAGAAAHGLMTGAAATGADAAARAQVEGLAQAAGKVQ